MHAQALLTVTLGSLALATAKHHTSSYSYSNLETLYTSLTDSQGVVTGQPTSHPPVVTSFPASILSSMQSLQSEHDASASAQQGLPTTMNPATLTHLSPGPQTIHPNGGSGGGKSHTSAGKGGSAGAQQSSGASIGHKAHDHGAQHSPSPASGSDSGSGNGNSGGNNAGGQIQAASVGTMLAAAVAVILFA